MQIKLIFLKNKTTKLDCNNIVFINVCMVIAKSLKHWYENYVIEQNFESLL